MLPQINGKTLDLGAGSGKYKNLIKKYAGEYVALDGRAGINIDVVGDVAATPFADGEFDAVVCNQVLEHVREPWKVVAEIARILKSGGKCILTAPFLQPYHADPGDYFRYTKEGMKSLFASAGFDILECEGYGRTYSVLSEFCHFVFFDPYKKRSRWADIITNGIQRTAKFLDKFVKNEKIFCNIYIIAAKK